MCGEKPWAHWECLNNGTLPEHLLPPRHHQPIKKHYQEKVCLVSMFSTLTLLQKPSQKRKPGLYLRQSLNPCSALLCAPEHIDSLMDDKYSFISSSICSGDGKSTSSCWWSQNQQVPLSNWWFPVGRSGDANPGLGGLTLLVSLSPWAKQIVSTREEKAVVRGKLQIWDGCAVAIQALDIKWCEGMSLLGGLTRAAGWGYNGLAQNRRALINVGSSTFLWAQCGFNQISETTTHWAVPLNYRLWAGCYFVIVFLSFLLYSLFLKWQWSWAQISAPWAPR